MPRPPRGIVAGGVYHVTARGNRRQTVFLDDKDRRFFLYDLADVVADLEWSCLAYCLLGNHYHLLVRTPEPNLPEGMFRLNNDHAHRFNRRHGHDGHLFQHRYRSRRVVTDAHLLATARYIALNPVGAGLSRTPEAWPWSSHRIVVDPASTSQIVDRKGLLDRFAAWGGDGFERYVDFVAAGDPTAPCPEPPRDEPRRPPIDALIAQYGPDQAVIAAYHDFGYTARAIAEAQHRSAAAVGRHLRRLGRPADRRNTKEAGTEK